MNKRLHLFMDIIAGLYNMLSEISKNVLMTVARKVYDNISQCEITYVNVLFVF